MRRIPRSGRRFLAFLAAGSKEPPSRCRRPSDRLRRLALEQLEDRRLLSVGDLLHTLADPSMLPQQGSNFGSAVATNGNLAVVGVPNASLQGYATCGSVDVFNTSTGALVTTLVNPVPTSSNQFGNSVAISGNTVVVGARYSTANAGDVGVAYLFDATTGSLLRTLANPAPSDGDFFGCSVAISGNTVVVGAYGDDTGATGAGAAYVFDATTGGLVSTLANPTPAAIDHFGASVAVSGNTVVVGAYLDDTGATDAGSAYVFNAATGSLVSTLANPTPAANDRFGNSVAISGNTVVVGASHDDAGATDAGSAYLFDATTGSLLHTLANPTPTTYDYFGDSVAISGNSVVVGAHQENTATGCGAAYLFDAATGSLLHTLANPTPSAADSFGNTVAISGNTVVVGASANDTGATGAGVAHLFDATTGSLLHTLVNPTPAANDLFGSAVAVSGSTVVVGAYQNDIGATDAGAAYLFDATTGSLSHTLANPAPAYGANFGASVAIAGNIVVVGCPTDSTAATYAGAAYLFDASTGSLLGILTSPTPTTNNGFGTSVAISGSIVVVGAYLNDSVATGAGVAYVFNATTGSLLCTLADPTPAVDDYFGAAVAISGNTVVVGAYRSDAGATDAGAAYLFDATTGSLLANLANPTPAANDNFGSSVAIAGNNVVVGAPRKGAAYLFDATTGGLLHTLAGPTPAGDYSFGTSVAIAGNNVLVGMPLQFTATSEIGVACLFDASTGSLLDTLDTPTSASYDYFGNSMAISNGIAVVGAPDANGITLRRGAAYLFNADGPPTDISLSATSIAAMRPAGTLVGTFSTTDPDLPSDSHSYTLVSGEGSTDNSSFTIDAGGHLLTAASFNYLAKNSYKIRVRTTDQEGLWFEKQFTITVTSLMYTLNDPSMLPQAGSEFGGAVAADGNFTVVGAADSSAQGCYESGCAYVFNTSTGALLATLANPTPADFDYFGYSVAISGNTVVVGAYEDDTGATDAGAAYLFDATTGNLLRALLDPTPAQGDHFGTSVAISGTTVVVGAPYHKAGATYVFDATTGNLSCTLANPTNTGGENFGDSVAIAGTTVVVGAPNAGFGTVYLFGATTGGLSYTLADPTPAQGENFGASVAISGNTVVVGTLDDTTDATHDGKAFLFDATTGNLLRTLANPTPAEGHYFGTSVAISGNTVVVGAYADDTSANAFGAAYVFDATTGNLLAALDSPLSAASGNSGNSVAVSGNTVVVGTPYNDTHDSGAAYFFDATTGNLLHTLANPAPAALDNFGNSVAVSGNTVVVGAYQDDTGATDAGAVYLFDATTGSLLHKLTEPTPAPGNYFGFSVAISGNTVVVGALNGDASGPDAGAVYLFDATTGNLLRTLNKPASLDRFGYSLAISGNNVLVGEPYDTSVSNGGAAYLFDASTGNLVTTLADPAPIAGNAEFGYSVAISGSTALVGAPWAEAAYVFNAATGTLLYTLAKPAPGGRYFFGNSVALSGNTAVVGEDAGSNAVGTVYLFDATTGALSHTLTNPSQAPHSYGDFGHSVAISGSTVLVAAMQDNTGALGAGAAYVFDATTGNLLATLANPTPAADDCFGYSVAVSGGVAVVGTPYEDGLTVDRGAAYLFDVGRPPVVTNVLVRGSTWTSSFASYAGYSIPVGSGAQLVTLPWGNIDQIKVVFSKDVVIDSADLLLSGVNTKAYNFSGGTFSYDSSTFTATWTFPRAIGPDKLMICLDADGSRPIVDASGNRLDGDWTNPASTTQSGSSTYPSGDGTAGGDFLFRFNVLAGDAGQDSTVGLADLNTVLTNYGKSGMTWGQGDFTGDGVVGLADLNNVLTNYGMALPSGEPAAGSFPAGVSLLAAVVPTAVSSASAISVAPVTTVAAPAASVGRRLFGPAVADPREIEKPSPIAAALQIKALPVPSIAAGVSKAGTSAATVKAAAGNTAGGLRAAASRLTPPLTPANAWSSTLPWGPPTVTCRVIQNGPASSPTNRATVHAASVDSMIAVPPQNELSWLSDVAHDRGSRRSAHDAESLTDAVDTVLTALGNEPFAD